MSERKKFVTEDGQIVVNGRVYPLWQQFEQQKDEWIGGQLEALTDHPEVVHRAGEITDIALEPNSHTTSAFFVIRTLMGGVAFDVMDLAVATGQGGSGIALESMNTGAIVRITKKGEGS